MGMHSQEWPAGLLTLAGVLMTYGVFVHRSNMGMMNMAISVVRQDKFLGLWSGVWPVSSAK